MDDSETDTPKPRPARLKLLRGWMLAIGVLALVASGLIAMGGKGATTSQNPAARKHANAAIVMVTAEPATCRTVQRKIGVVGSFWGRDEIAITPKVEGRIVQVRRDVGDIVRPGDVLMEIDQTDYRLAAQEGLRALEVELSRLSLRLPDRGTASRDGTPLEREMARLGLRDFPPSNLDVTRLPAIQKAAAQERNAIAKRDRLRKLTMSATVEEQEQAETEAAVAQASYQQALLEAQAIVALVRLKKASFETALQRLIDTRVVVPASTPLTKSISLASVEPSVIYLVAQRSVAAGEKAVANVPAFRLVIADPLKLLVTVPERHLREVKLEQVVELFVESHPNEPFRGQVSRIHPIVDRENRSFVVEVLIPNANYQLSAGSFVSGSIITRVDDRALTVPEEAIVQTAGMTSVFVLRNGKAVEIPVEVGVRLEVSGSKRNRWSIEVRGKLQAGDAVITSGQTQLADGTPANVRPSSVE